MTIYFYLPKTPTDRQISKLYSLSFFDKDYLRITCEYTFDNDIRVNIQTNQEIYSIDVLTRIQDELKHIFNTSIVFVR